MPRKARVCDVRIVESADGRFVVETYDDGTIVRRRVERDTAPRRKPRKPFVRIWRRREKP